MYISKHNFKTRLPKHEFEHIVGITRDKQHIVINCLEIWQNYFINITKNFLSNAHINLETYNKKLEGTARNIAHVFTYLCYFSSTMQFLGHYTIERSPTRTVVFKQSHFIYPLDIDILNLLYTVVFTRAQLDTLSRKKLAEELTRCPNIADQLRILTNRLDDFVGKYDKLQSELVISKNCNSLLFNRIINLGRNGLSNAHYIRREMLVINPVPHSISNVDFEEKVCKVLSLTALKLSQKILMPVTE